jgi:hypothetical protein
MVHYGCEGRSSALLFKTRLVVYDVVVLVSNVSIMIWLPSEK